MKTGKTKSRLQNSLHKTTTKKGEIMPAKEIANIALERGFVIPKLQITAGGWPVPDFRNIIPKDIFDKIAARTDRIKIESVNKVSSFSLKDGLRGGMVIPHMHIGNEIMLFDKATMKSYFQAVADSIDKIEDISDSKAYLRF